MNRSFFRNVLCLTVIALVILIGCSKKEEQAASGGSTILDTSPVASKISDNALLFYLWDAENAGYKNYRTTFPPLGLEDLKTKLQSMSNDESAKRILALYEGLEKIGLISAPPAPDPIRAGVIFADYDAASKEPRIGLYFQSASGNNFKDKLSALEGVLKDSGLGVARESKDGLEIYKATFPQGSTQPTLSKFVFSANEQGLGVSNNEQTLLRLFQQTQPPALLKSARLQQVAKASGFSSQDFSFAYVDVQGALSQLSGLIPAEAQQNVNLKEIPVEALAARRRMTTTLNDQYSVALTAGTDKQKKWIGALNGSSFTGDSLKSFPASAVLYLGLSGDTLSKAKDIAISEMPGEESKAIGEQLALLSKIKSVNLAVLNAGATSPLPGILIVAGSSSVDETVAALKGQLDGLITTNQLPVAPWESKEIAGSKVNYVVSPLGIGVYLGSHGDNVILASSEETISEALTLLGGKGTTLLSSLPAAAQSVTSVANLILCLRLNFVAMGDLINSVQGSLAMFTGGQGQAAYPELDALRTMGGFTLAASFNEGVLSVQTHYEAPAKQVAQK